MLRAHSTKSSHRSRSGGWGKEGPSCWEQRFSLKISAVSRDGSSFLYFPRRQQTTMEKAHCLFAGDMSAVMRTLLYKSLYFLFLFLFLCKENILSILLVLDLGNPPTKRDPAQPRPLCAELRPPFPTGPPVPVTF